MTRKQVSLQMDTYEDLDEIRSRGQSFDGVVQELLEKQKIEVEA